MNLLRINDLFINPAQITRFEFRTNTPIKGSRLNSPAIPGVEVHFADGGSKVFPGEEAWQAFLDWAETSDNAIFRLKAMHPVQEAPEAEIPVRKHGFF